MATTANRERCSSSAGSCLLVLFAILAALNAFNMGIPNPATTQQFFVLRDCRSWRFFCSSRFCCCLCAMC